MHQFHEKRKEEVEKLQDDLDKQAMKKEMEKKEKKVEKQHWVLEEKRKKYPGIGSRLGVRNLFV